MYDAFMSMNFITLQEPDPRTHLLLGDNKGIKKGQPVRPSQFAVVFNYDGQRILYNTFTGQCVRTDRLSWFESSSPLPFDPENPEMAALIQADFLVSAEIDEAARYEQILTLLRKMEPPFSGYTSYTILPTTACNARCFYCYEAGISYETMDDRTADDAVRYILATRQPEKALHLHWFGGEPLLGERIIDRITSSLRERGISFRSGMITNGSLMTEEMAHKAADDWQLRNVQITLDGRERVYCERKNYRAFQGSPYRAVLDGIHALLAGKVSVSIRLNADEENLPEMHALVRELSQEFANDKGLRIYAHSIFVRPEERTGHNDQAFYDALEELNAVIRHFNKMHNDGGNPGQNWADSIPVPAEEEGCEADKAACKDEKAGIPQDSAKKRKGHTKRYFCMADHPDAGPVIMPDGALYICEHVGSLPSAGHIRDMKPVDRSVLVATARLSISRCRSCPLLPVCTDYSGCPVCNKDCFRENLASEKSRLAWIVKQE